MRTTVTLLLGFTNPLLVQHQPADDQRLSRARLNRAGLHGHASGMHAASADAIRRPVLIGTAGRRAAIGVGGARAIACLEA